MFILLFFFHQMSELIVLHLVGVPGRAINQDMHHFGYLMVVCGYIHPKGFTITWRELWLSEYHRSVLAIKSTECVQWKDALCLYRNMTIQVLIPSKGISVVKLSYLGYAFKGEHDHACRSLGGKKMNVFCGCDMVVHGAPCGKSAPTYDMMVSHVIYFWEETSFRQDDVLIGTEITCENDIVITIHISSKKWPIIYEMEKGVPSF